MRGLVHSKLIVVLTFVTAAPVSATTTRDVTLDQLVGASDLVVLGRVEHVDCLASRNLEHARA